ncbi:glycoside hydrolase family 3 protein [Candidatus Zixiibacteriota bacterium]
MRRFLFPIVTIVLFSGTGCSFFHRGPDPMSPEGQALWVEETLAGMSSQEKAASLVGIAVTAGFSHVDAPERTGIEALVRDLGVGCIAMWGGDPYDEAITISRLQEIADIPLLVAADNEWGLAQRIDGSTLFPKAMALGAAGDTALARAMGYVTGIETRAIGIHMGYAPVADVNNNPLNPIISVRSFGEDPDLVFRMAYAWSSGARDAGMLTTAKHFPGHGDTSVDSHIDLPVVDVSMERLQRMELAPFRALVESGGVDAIMTAHLWVSAFDPDETIPASLSVNITRRYLREELGFEGLIVTDALRMGAVVQNYGVEEAAVMAVRAGADLLLLPADAERSVNGILRAVREGRLDQELVNAAAQKILAAKARLGLHIRRNVPLSEVDRVVGDPEVRGLVEVISSRSITVVKNEGTILPLGQGSGSAAAGTGRYASMAPPAASGPFTPRHDLSSASSGARVVFLALSSDPGSGAVGRAFFSPLRQLYPEARHLTLYPDPGREEAENVVSAVEDADLVVVAVISRVRDQKGHAAVVEEHASLLRYVAGSGIPTVVAAFGPPYFISQFPGVDAYVAAFDYGEDAQRAAGEMILGRTGARGRLPVSIPGYYEIGWGISVGPATGR